MILSRKINSTPTTRNDKPAEGRGNGGGGGAPKEGGGGKGGEGGGRGGGGGRDKRKTVTKDQVETERCESELGRKKIT